MFVDAVLTPIAVIVLAIATSLRNLWRWVRARCVFGRAKREPFSFLPGAPAALVNALQPATDVPSGAKSKTANGKNGKKNGASTLDATELQRLLAEGSYSEVLEGRLKLGNNGYVAAQNLKQGDPLLFDTAFCASAIGQSACKRMVDQCQKKRETRFFQEEVMPLGTSSASRFLDESGAGGKHVEAILANHARECSREPEYVALFVSLTRFKHSCQPNAFIDSSQSQAVVRALCDIKVGDEVSVSYVPVSLSIDARRCRLGQGFSCPCKRCEEESIADPQLSVACKCGEGYFTSRPGSPEKQICKLCGASFDLTESLRHLGELESANDFMLKPETARANQADLAHALEKRLETNDNSSAPQRHPAFLQLINNVSNSYYYASRTPKSDRNAMLSKFYEYKKRALVGLEANHGLTNQRDAQYFLCLHRLLMGDFPTTKERAACEQQLESLCVLHFGQKAIPAGLLQTMRRR